MGKAGRKGLLMKYETYDDLALIWASDDCEEDAEIPEEEFDMIREEHEHGKHG